MGQETGTERKNVSVIGLGKLGFPLAVCMANKGFNVIALDMDKAKLAAMRKARAPFYEPGLQKLLGLSRKRLHPTGDYAIAIGGSDITFIVVATPSIRNGNFSNKHVLKACRSIGEAIKKKPHFHIVVITSTMMPGSIDSEIKPALERYSGKRCGVDFGLCYNPEFIALGNIIHDLYYPDFVLIGESDKKSGSILEAFYKKFCNKKVNIARMNFINSELTKLSLNAFITMKISFANALSRLCETMPGADIDAVTGRWVWIAA